MLFLLLLFFCLVPYLWVLHYHHLHYTHGVCINIYNNKKKSYNIYFDTFIQPIYWTIFYDKSITRNKPWQRQYLNLKTVQKQIFFKDPNIKNVLSSLCGYWCLILLRNRFRLVLVIVCLSILPFLQGIKFNCSDILMMNHIGLVYVISRVKNEKCYLMNDI